MSPCHHVLTLQVRALWVGKGTQAGGTSRVKMIALQETWEQERGISQVEAVLVSADEEGPDIASPFLC